MVGIYGTKMYRIFISHAWEYNDEYYRLINMLDKALYFTYINYSVPEHDPIRIRPSDQLGLEQALYDQIRPTHIVLILSGMYVNYRKWIQKEIDIALELRKPIIGIIPWGQERILVEVQSIANEMVGWSTLSIVDTIRRNAL